MASEVFVDGITEARRDLLRRNYNLFATRALEPVGQAPARHHRVVNRELTRLGRGEIDRLMLLMPPGSAKSTYGNVLFVPWLLEQPGIQHVITSSSGGELAQEFLASSHRVVDEMQSVLSYQLETARADLWRTTTGKSVLALGAGAKSAGRRADLILIDDPFGSWEEANRESERNRIYDWYTGDLINRLKPGGRVLLINTHWHQDDLSGRLIEKMQEGGDRWVVVTMQAIYDGTVVDPLGRAEGEALWPEWENVEALNRKRLINGEMKWAALFQQDPRPRNGLLFKIDMLRVVEPLAAPYRPGPGAFDPRTPAEHARRSVRYWDIAATEAAVGRVPDWTVGLRLTQIGNRWIIEDVVRIRGTPAEVKRVMRATAIADGTSVRIGIPQDPAAAGKFMVADMVSNLAGFDVTAMREQGGNKAERARPVASQMEAGNIDMVRAGWNDALKDELRAFPAGRFKDQADALVGAYSMLIKQSGTVRVTSIM